MAEILLTAVINKSVEIAGNLLFQKGSSLDWLKQDIDWLHREMRHIRSYIDNAKAKAIEGDSRVKNLISDIQELAGDVEDLLDEFLPKIQQSNKCKAVICWLKTTCFAHKFAMEIDKIKRRVADVDRVRTTYNITDTSYNNNDCIPLDQRRLFLRADENEVIGLDDEFNMLQAKLLDQDLPFGAVCIVGMPGLGKTTLAKKLYRCVRDQFECSGLVYVSQQPRAAEILLEIAKQVGVMEEERNENLEVNLRSLLKRKRYVILLDDIWDVEIWDALKLVIPAGCDSRTCSRIIITSRNSNVGRYIGGDSSLHMLQPLDSEKSFQLFTKKIFSYDNNNWANASPQLLDIGKNIVGKCGGIPLAIVVTAGMLRARERRENAWDRVLQSMGHKIQEGCFNVLAMSYNDLPIALRPCFLYFGLYPEDHEIRAFDLTNMWIAEKLIVVNNGNMQEAENTAEDILNELVSRNLIQVAKSTYDGRISSCRIHDLLHSLCVALGEESNFFHTKHDAFGNPDLRRITFYSDSDLKKFFCSNPTTKKLRALFCFAKDDRIFSQMAHLDFKLLQVLVIVPSQRYYDVIPNIGNMSSLRYLRLEAFDVGIELQNYSVVKLKHLQTLDVGKMVIRFPSGIWESKQLRHLRSGRVGASSGCFPVSPFCPNSIYSLPNNLQTLMGLRGQFFQTRLLHRLTNLRKLSILEVSNSTIKMLSVLSPGPIMLPATLEVLKLYFLGHVSEQINLSSYQNIVKLHLKNNARIMPSNSEAFPPNLIKLTLGYLEVDEHLLAVLKKLPKLRILKMERCGYNAEKMDLSCDANGDSFPQLEVLHIKDPRYLLAITCTDDVSMPKLKKLILLDSLLDSLDDPITLSERLAKLRV